MKKADFESIHFKRSFGSNFKSFFLFQTGFGHIWEHQSTFSKTSL